MKTFAELGFPGRLIAVEGLTLGRTLQFNEMPGLIHHHIHVRITRRIFGVLQIE